ncbi:MAG: flagellar basal body L-ring protein FlgH [Bdellovibrionales bacterium]|nr:flagellar basal body L-ring protein FlgH [Bdellovibrionales bacterium]
MLVYKNSRLTVLAIVFTTLSSCMSVREAPAPMVPALEFARYAKQQGLAGAGGANTNSLFQHGTGGEIPKAAQSNPQTHFQSSPDLGQPTPVIDTTSGRAPAQVRYVSGDAADMRASADFSQGNFSNPPQMYPYGPRGLNPSDYNGPLSLGDPGVSASLWRDSSGTPDFFRDHRAYQPMDLIMVQISESSEGKKKADTDLSSQSDVLTGISSFFGFENDLENSHPSVETSSLVQASAQNDFKGEGETNRKDSLTGSISCMVMEVLPSNILRIEGMKIISVNNEEQVMVLSGLVRPRDISSDNLVQSSRVANMRIDYYGTGQVGNLQREGWLGTFLRKVWPF